MNTYVEEQVNKIVPGADQGLEKLLQKFAEDKKRGGAKKAHFPAIGHVGAILPLYCQPKSKFYHDASLVPIMNEIVDHMLKMQLPSGNVSLNNCNIDSPPDTSFYVHGVINYTLLAIKDGSPELEQVRDGLKLFLKRAEKALLTSGIHTPNHRWVLTSALAKYDELFNDPKYRERAFVYLNEGIDITEYGEWTERSNSVYSPICAYHMYDVGRIWGYEPAMDAVRKTLHHLKYMLHPGNTIATEYSGRQDFSAVASISEIYYITYHLMASHDQDPVLAGMAKLAAEHATLGNGSLVNIMLYPEKMTLPQKIVEVSENYTLLFGENNTVPVPDKVWYTGPVVKHPHGAPVLRHRRGKMSITVMAGQTGLVYVQFGKARMTALKLGFGWFGIGSIAFPGMKQIGDDLYRMEVELQGSYFGPLSEEHTKGKNGVYVDMPNHLRELTSVITTKVAVEFRLHEDGIDVRVLSDDERMLFLQPHLIFDAAGELSGEHLTDTGLAMQRLEEGSAVYRFEGDCIKIEGGAYEHEEISMRNENINVLVKNLMVNLTTPTDATLKIRCYSEG